MRLLLDVGNTRIKWAWEEAGQLSKLGGLAHARDTQSCLDAEVSFDQAPNSVWLSSVASDRVNSLVENWVTTRFNLEVKRAVVTEQACGIKNNYAELPKLGVDRWLAALGARRYCPEGHVILIDAGTAITIDVLSENNVFLGGAILPGATLMHDALLLNTAGIASQFTDSVRLIGNTTQECVNSGVQYGLVGAVDRIVTQMHAELNKDRPDAAIEVLLTGGDANLILRDSSHKYRFVEGLVLQGLASIADVGV